MINHRSFLTYSTVAALILISTAAVVWHSILRHSSPAITIPTGTNPVIPLAIIGSGPAGLSAALYGARAKIHTVVFEGPQPGGQLTTTSLVENWPGVGSVLGKKVIEIAREQAASFGALFSTEQIVAIDCSHYPYTLETNSGTKISAFTLVLATGASPKRLSVPGEDEYWGKGVTSCAVCDAPFFKDKDVVVVGGGDSAAEEALQLVPFARNITLLIRGETMRASAIMQARLQDYPQIKIRSRSSITKITGDGMRVTGIDLSDGTTLPIDGVFLAIGHIPNIELLKNTVSLTKQNLIALKPGTQKTSLPGIFAAGDVTDGRYRQAGVASGDGIKAGLDALEFLREHGYIDTIAVQLSPRLYNPADHARKPLESIESEELFSNRVLNNALPVLVDFYSDYCPSCDALLPHLERFAAQQDGTIDVVKVHITNLPSISKTYTITGAPTLILFENGSEIQRISGLITADKLAQLVI
jgi:thioredoxin reductase (NADPH)